MIIYMYILHFFYYISYKSILYYILHYIYRHKWHETYHIDSMVTFLNIQRNSMAQHLEFLAQGFQHRCGQLRGAVEDHGEELLAERPKKTTEVHRRTGRFHHEKWWKMVIEPINTWWTCWDISIKHGEIWWFHVDLTMKIDLTWGFKQKFWWQPGGFNWFN